MSTPRDVAAGLRGMARDVQRFGLLSASDVVERYVHLVERTADGARAPASAGRGAGTPAQGVPWADGFAGTDTTALVESVTAVANSYLSLLDEATRLASPPADAHDAVVLPAARPGETTHAPVWVHNPAADPTGPATMTLTPLVSARGAHLDAASVRCQPSLLDGIDPGGSLQVDVVVRVPLEQPSDIYHGLLLSSLAVDGPMPVRVEVMGP